LKFFKAIILFCRGSAKHTHPQLANISNQIPAKEVFSAPHLALDIFAPGATRLAAYISSK